jgi:hypothetical protein
VLRITPPGTTTSRARRQRYRLWSQMVGIYPTYAEYQKKTTRRIPVVVLEPL